MSASQPYAGLGSRIVAFALDYIIIAGYLFIVIAVGVAGRTFVPSMTQTLFATPVSGQLAGFLSVTLPISLYFIFLESSDWQATWGKRRRGLRVTQAGGVQLSFPHALSRTVLKFMPWELAHTCIWQMSSAQSQPSALVTSGFILVWILVAANVVSLWLSPTRQTLYDRLARTYVIRTSD